MPRGLVVVDVAHHGFFLIVVILGSGVPRHDAHKTKCDIYGGRVDSRKTTPLLTLSIVLDQWIGQREKPKCKVRWRCIKNQTLSHYTHTAYVELRNESGMQNGTIRNQDL